MADAEKILHNYQNILSNIHKIIGHHQVRIVPVTKSVGIDEIQILTQLGFDTFGENRIEMLLDKKNKINNPLIHFDFIGNIQSRKIPEIIDNAALIHSVSSLEIAQKISNRSQQKNIKTNILLQVNTSGEIQKSGFTPEEISEQIEQLKELTHLRIRGLMTMAPHTENKTEIEAAFRDLRKLHEKLKPIVGNEFTELSMGMSEDYPIALAEGATILRIGSLFFKEGNI